MSCRNFIRASVFFTVLLISLVSFSQNKVVSGRVTDAAGAGVAGVNVSAKGTTAGTQTNAEGNYSLTVSPGVTTLVFSSVGFTTIEEIIGDRTTVNISLAQGTSSLGEVVVVAYGTRRRGDLTGSVTSVTAKDFQKGNIASSEQLLVGKVAGLQVTTGGGSAGGGSRLRIRGTASLNASRDPLIVVDGIPVEGNGIAGSGNLLNTINPDDIESISVLKDASASALYGSRATNGVVIITTKKGSKGKIRFNFNTQFSVSSLVKKVDVLTGDQIRSIVEQDGAARNDSTFIKLLGPAGTNTDWQDQIYRTAFGTNNNISASGAIGEVPFRASLGYTNQAGILKTNEFNRYSASLNLSPKLFSDHLTVNLNLKGSHTKNRFADEGAVGNAITFDPTKPVFDLTPHTIDLGGYWEWRTLSSDSAKPLANRNPLSMLEQRNNRSTVNRFIGNVQFDYKLHFFPDLHVLLNLGLDYTSGSGDDISDSTLAGSLITAGRVAHYEEKKKNYLVDVSLFYTKEFKSIRSKLDVLLTHSYQDFVTEVFSFPSFSRRGNHDTIPGSIPNFAYDKPQFRLESYLGRINYTLNDKYLLTASLRRDASSRFSPEARVGYFPAFAFAWKIKEEFFSNSNTINELKLRLGWGQTGQQDGIAYYPYLPRYTLSRTTASYQFGNEFVQFLRPTAYDRFLEWEKGTTTNVGIDFGLLNNRITGNLDLYSRKTNDLLSEVDIAPGSNFNITLVTNVGNIENKGVEFSINTIPIQNKNLTWNFGFNIAYNDVKVTNLELNPSANFKGINVSGISGGTGNQIGKHIVGYAPHTFFVYKQIYDPETGSPIEGLYEDLNRDGSIDDNDRYLYKKPAPDVNIGLSSSVNFKQWTFGIAGHGSFGNYLYNNYFSNGAVLRGIVDPILVIRNGSANYLETRFSNNQYFSDYYIENASFFRLDNINIGYNAGRVFNNSASLRLMANVQNVFVITKYKGLDPENAGDAGVDNNIYPRPRIFSIGASLDF